MKKWSPKKIKRSNTKQEKKKKDKSIQKGEINLSDSPKAIHKEEKESIPRVSTNTRQEASESDVVKNSNPLTTKSSPTEFFEASPSSKHSQATYNSSNEAVFNLPHTVRRPDKGIETLPSVVVRTNIETEREQLESSPRQTKLLEDPPSTEPIHAKIKETATGRSNAITEPVGPEPNNAVPRKIEDTSNSPPLLTRVTSHSPPKLTTSILKMSTQDPAKSEELAESEEAFQDKLYKELHKLFGPSDGQVLALEFPGRVLDEGTYFFSDDNPLYANVTKPQVVKEAEFRLSDALYNVDLNSVGRGHIVGGPNGQKLSTSYEEVLSTLVPKMDDFGYLYEDRNKMRLWLLEPIEDSIEPIKDETEDSKGEPNPEPLTFKGSRMAFYQKLTEIYETERVNWEKERNKRLSEATKSKDPEKLDTYLKWLATNGPGREAKIAARYNDLVVRGYYHEVRRILAYIDVASPAEILEECKEKMRNSAMLSMDESETLYPVQMQPVSWAKSLTSDFEPSDLLLSPNFINEKLMAKYAERDGLENQIQLLQSRPTGNVKELQNVVNKAVDDVNTANSDMIKNFSEATFTAAKIAYKAYLKKNKKNANDKKAATDLTKTNLEEEGKSNNLELTDDEFNLFQNYQKKAIENQTKLNESSRQLAYALEQKTKAEATDTKDGVLRLQGELATLNREIEGLKKIALAGTPATETTPAKKLHPSNKAKVGEFFDVTIHSSKHQQTSESELVSGSTASETNVSLIFGSYGSSSTSSSSDSSNAFEMKDFEFDVGFRATKVTIDRGGWFDPEVLAASNAMYSTNSNSTNSEKINFNETFSTFPVAFIIAKDITIHFKMSEEKRADFAEAAEGNSSSGGGFLCFGHHTSSASETLSKGSFSGRTEEGVSIRIPGAQILMWVLQEVPVDNSAPYPTDKSAIPANAFEALSVRKPDEEKPDAEKPDEGKQ